MKTSFLPILAAVVFLPPHSLVLGQVLPFRQYTTKDGLPSNQINAICQDSRGFLWIGTNNGLSVYDGVRFTNYSTVDGLGNNWITGIIESRKSPGTMWLATIAAGVNQWVDGRFVQISLGESTNANNIDSIIEDERGVLWCGAVDGIHLIEKDLEKPGSDGSISEGRHTTHLRSTRLNWAINLAMTPSGSVWASLSDTVVIYSSDAKKLDSFRVPVARGAYITCMSTDPEGNVWIGASDSTIFQYRDTTKVQQCKLTLGAAVQIINDRQGHLWVRTPNGLIKISVSDFAKGDCEHNPIAGQSPLDGTGRILLDRENNLWLGTWFRGLLKLTDQNVYRIPLTADENGGIIVCDSSGHIWLACKTGLLEIFKNRHGRWQKYEHRLDPTASLQVSPVQCDALGRLWLWMKKSAAMNAYAIGTNAGRPSKLSLVTTLVRGRHFPSGGFASFYADPQNRAWLGIDYLDVIVIDVESQKTLRVYKKDDAAPGHSIRAMYQDRQGNIWLGDFEEGLAMLYASDEAPEKFKKFTTADGLPDNRIRSIHQDRDGQIWIGTRNGGVARYAGGKFQVVSMKDGLRSDAIWWIGDDERDRLWLHTNVGLESIDRKSLKHLPANSALLGERVYFCGLHRDEFIWFLTVDALTIYEYSRTAPNLAPPPVHLHRFLVNGKPNAMSDGIELPHDQNNCTIEFVGLSLKDEKEVRYQYRLRGIETDWSTPTEHREVTYANLHPDDYAFEVIAINGDGMKSSRPAVLRFSIQPPFWQRWWFFTLALGSFLVLAALAYRYRVNQLLSIERLRTRIASDLHDDVGATLTRIAVHSEVIQNTRNPEKILASSQAIGGMSREIISTLSDVVWAIDARHDKFGDLVDRMRSFALDMLTLKEFQVHFVTEGVNPEKRIKAAVRQNLYLIFKEAVNNVARHAGAKEVHIQLQHADNELKLVIQDDGSGLPEAFKSSGHGLKNMQERAKRIGGRLEFDNDHGLKMTVRVKSN